MPKNCKRITPSVAPPTAHMSPYILQHMLYPGRGIGEGSEEGDSSTSRSRGDVYGPIHPHKILCPGGVKDQWNLPCGRHFPLRVDHPYSTNSECDRGFSRSSLGRYMAHQPRTRWGGACGPCGPGLWTLWTWLVDLVDLAYP